MTRFLDRAETFEPRGTLLSASRSLLAFAELTVLLFTPDRLLFGSTPYASPRQLCSGVSGLSLWCVSGGGPRAEQAGTVVAVAVLVAVTAGFRPRWLCIPHWYIAFSLAGRMSALNGGEEIAQIFTLLLIPQCLGDTRTWHWRRPDQPMAPAWRGSAYAAHLLLRLQIVVVYLDAALSKLAYPAWQHGTAVRTLLNDPQNGLPLALRPLADHLLGPIWISAAVTWSVIAMELGIATSMLFRARVRRRALALAVCLHTAIILAMGLFSFGLVMIALLMATPGGALRQRPRLRPRAAVAPGAEPEPEPEAEPEPAVPVTAPAGAGAATAAATAATDPAGPEPGPRCSGNSTSRKQP